MALDLKKPHWRTRQIEAEQQALDDYYRHLNRNVGDDVLQRKAEFRRLAACLGLSLGDLAPLLGKSKHSLASWSSITHIVGPSREIILQLDKMVFAHAHASLQIGRALEASKPLTEEEFRAALTAEFNLRLIKDSELSAKSRLPGRIGYLGIVHVGISPELNYSQALLQGIETGWVDYRRLLQEAGTTPDPLADRDARKRLTSWLVTGLNLPRQRLADMTGRKLSAINSWLGDRWPTSPPENVTLDLMRLHLRWAVDFLLYFDLAILDRPLPAVPDDWVFRNSERDDNITVT